MNRFFHCHHERIDVDRALAIAQRHFPRAAPAWIETPEDERGVYRIRLMQPGEPSRRFPHSLVWIDQYTGTVLADYDARHTTANDTVMNWLHALHKWPGVRPDQQNHRVAQRIAASVFTIS
jgi:uncharacterized iron-regulated membrane protein